VNDPELTSMVARARVIALTMQAAIARINFSINALLNRCEPAFVFLGLMWVNKRIFSRYKHVELEASLIGRRNVGQTSIASRTGRS
jgi:hypothetical protein